ncbi:hypothetical protein ACS0TU_24975, partial [Enterobacter hormaechei]
MTVDSLIGKMRKNTPVKESSARQGIRLRLKAPDRSHFRKDQGRNASGKNRWQNNQLSPKWITVRIDFPSCIRS